MLLVALVWSIVSNNSKAVKGHHQGMKVVAGNRKHLPGI